MSEQRKDKLTLREITDIIESAAPLKWQEAWDNSGLQVGQSDTEIKSVLLTVDVTETVLQEALERGCNLVVSHHPLLFHGLKHLTGHTTVERCVAFALRHDIAVYSAHTTIDSYLNGVSGRMAEKCGLNTYQILAPASQDAPYGLGVTGMLEQPQDFMEWLRKVKTAFLTPMLRYVPPKGRMIQKLALCGGAGGEFIGEAVRQGADVYVSADMRYHDMQAAAGQIGLVDMDHWVSEQFVRDVMQEMLSPFVPAFVATTDCTPVRIL